MKLPHARVGAFLALSVAACVPIRKGEEENKAGSGPEVHGYIKVQSTSGPSAEGSEEPTEFVSGDTADEPQASSESVTGDTADGRQASNETAPAQRASGPQDLTADFEVPEGAAVTLWAESPDLYNPTAIDVDARGRVWVTEAVNYRQWSGRNPGRHHDEGDRVLVLEDSDGDGACDRSKVFVQDKDLVSPLGIAVLGDPLNPKRTRVVVSCSPSIYIWTDEDGDDKPDKKEVFLTGFGGPNHDHGVHSVVVGPDGRWYFAVGNAGPHVVTDKSGWTLRSGSLYRDGGEHQADNHPGLVSDDGRVWVGGLILRCEPDGTKLTVMAHNFRNEYEVALDSFGNMFTADNDDDGNAGCRTTWVMEGGNYGFFSADGSRYWQADRRPGQSYATAHWHQDDPGVCPAGTINGAGGPTGVCVYEGELVPQMRGRVLNADAGANVVYAHEPVAKGAGIELAPGKLIASRPQSGEKKDRWFRPSDVCAQTDGSILVADWWDPGVGGHQAGDAQAYGRILRIAPKGHRPSPPKIDVSTVAGAIEALKSPAVHVRALGAAALERQERQARVALQDQFVSHPDPYFRARALYSISNLAPLDRQPHLTAAMTDPDPDIRITALRAIRRAPAPPSDIYSLAVPAGDSSLAVRREAAIALARSNRFMPRSGSEDSARIYKTMLKSFDGTDRWFLEALAQGMERSDRDSQRVTALAFVGSSTWTEADAALVWRLRPGSAAQNIALRARSAELTPAQRRQAVETLAFMKDWVVGEAMLDLALAGPEDVRGLAAWWVEHNDTNVWRDYHLAQQLGPRGIEGAEMRWSSGILTVGSKPVDVDVDVAGSKNLWLVVTDGKTGNSCDWVDWIEPVFSGPAGDVRLTSLDWASAKAAWGETRKNENANGGPLKLDGQVLPDGIGTHARSEVVYRVPDGVARFRARAILDDGGTKQGGAPDVEFQVWTDRARDPNRWKALERALVDAAAKPGEVEASARAMAVDRDGGLALVRLAGAKKLTPAAIDAVARFIFENPDLSVRALASEHFPRTSARPALAPVEDLLALPGDAARGARLFFGLGTASDAVPNPGERAQCSTCHAFHGQGGAIGPDLSTVTSKYGRKEILDAILQPSAAIAFGYDSWMIETQDGLVVNGFVLSEGEEVVLKDTSGRRHVIPIAEIESRTKQRVSTMPDNVATGLSGQDLADVVALLSSDPRKPGKRLEKRSLFNGKDLSGWTFFLTDPKARMEDVWSVKDGVLSCKGNPVGYIRTTEDFTSFVLTLEWRFDPALGAGNSGVLLRMVGEDKVWPKSIEAQLHSRNAGDIWNIDDVSMQADPARTNGRRTEKRLPCNEKPLGEWNRYMITLDGGELTLEVNGEVQNTAHWCDETPGKICLQSEGAAIQFRAIAITPIER